MAGTVAIIQARMGASRLPNKMLLHLHGYPVIEWVRRRCMQARRVDVMVFALPDTSDNDVLHEYLAARNAHVFRGSESDVLDRYYQAARMYGADNIVRVCADNPLLAASEVDRLIDFFASQYCDYAYNHIPRGNRYPDGLGAEITSFPVLERMWKEASSPDFREHVFNYIHAHPDRFSIRTFDPESVALHHPELRMDIDTIDDYRKLMRLPLCIDMDAEQIIKVMQKGKSDEDT